MRLDIDWTRCDGSGLCAQLLAGHVARDEWGYPAFPPELPPGRDADARRAVAACPALALRLSRPRQTSHPPARTP